MPAQNDTGANLRVARSALDESDRKPVSSCGASNALSLFKPTEPRLLHKEKSSITLELLTAKYIRLDSSQDGLSSLSACPSPVLGV